MTKREPRPSYIEPELVNVYQTKDFRSELVESGGYRIVGSHAHARYWLRANAGNGFRKQFMDEAGYLRAEDEAEVEALITQLQAEHG